MGNLVVITNTYSSGRRFSSHSHRRGRSYVFYDYREGEGAYYRPRPAIDIDISIKYRYAYPDGEYPLYVCTCRSNRCHLCVQVGVC